MLKHIYTDRKDISIEEVLRFIEMYYDTNLQKMRVIYVRVSDLLKKPSMIEEIQRIVKTGLSDNKLVILQNDLSHFSVKKTLKNHIPSIYKNRLDEFERTIKTNMVAV